jgi:hypothetical protein
VKTSRTTWIGIGLGLYLLGFGMLAGTAVERMRFDYKRANVLRGYDEAVQEWRAFRMELEKNRGAASRTLRAGGGAEGLGEKLASPSR